jgi:putative ABC transport system permease protein
MPEVYRPVGLCFVREFEKVTEKLLAGLQSLPGVESVSLASNLPLQGAYGWKYEIEGEAPQEPNRRKTVSGVVITPEYFGTCGVTVARGRALTPSDGLTGNEVTIVNEVFAKAHFLHDDAIGKRLRLSSDDGKEPWLTVVGVAPQIRQNDPTRLEGDELIYTPVRQDPPRSLAVIARTRVPPTSLAAAFRKEVQKIDPDLPVDGVQSLDERLAEQRWPFRVFGTLFAIFGLFALTLASIGIYAVMAYSVGQRTQEIGVRIAMGASRANVFRLVFAFGLRRLAIGLVLGLGAAMAVTSVLRALLVQITPTDPVTFVAISALLSGIAALACWIPTRRAMRIDPMTALRYE